MSYITPKGVIAVGSVLPGLASIAVALRFYSRRLKGLSLGADDWLILCSLVLTIGLGLTLILGSAFSVLAEPAPQSTGPGGYFTSIDHAMIVTEKIFWSFNLVQTLSFGMAKLSVIYLYRRVFPSRVFKTISKVMIGTVVLWILGFFLTFFFICRTDFWASWSTLEVFLNQCIDSNATARAFCISDVVTDGLILSIPIYWVWKLQLPRSQRLAVCGSFLLGGLAIAAGIARLVIYIQQTTNAFSHPSGIELMTTEIYWSMIEMGLCIVAACLPTLRPLILPLLPRKFLSNIRNKSSYTSKSASQRSVRERSAKGSKDAESLSTASETEFVHRYPHEVHFGIETSVVRDLEAQNEVPLGNIMVQKSVVSHDFIKVSKG